ncbi:hypothetical protein J4410_07535 [Candidatus Woesearchaeota archaeon]|nr:hypothetical protein [Candidatus Woesearchaeota archaeon]
MADFDYTLLSMVCIIAIVALVVIISHDSFTFSFSDDMAGEAVRWKPGAEQHWCLCKAGIRNSLDVWHDDQDNPEPQLYGEACGSSFIIGLCQFDAEWYGFPNPQQAITVEVSRE